EHPDLAPDLDVWRHAATIAEPKRNGADRLQVRRDVLAGVTVAARAAAFEHAALIGEAHRQSIELGFGFVFDALELERFADAAVEALRFFGRKGVTDGEHRHARRYGLERRYRVSTHALGRRIRARKRRIFALDLLELTKERIVLRVADRRRVVDVVAVVVLL